MNGRGTVQRMGKIGRIALVCFVILALFLQGKTVALASTSTWTAQTSKSDLPMNGVAYGVDSNGHGLWVTGESNGKIDTSPDGVTWTFSSTQIDPGFNDYFSSAVYGSEWVLVGQIGEIVTSPDGSTWTKRNTPANTPDLLGVAYGGGTYVAVGQSGTILRSTDGATWSSQTGGTGNFWSVAYGGGQFVAVGDSGTLYTSSDGITWTHRTSGTTNNLNGVTFGGGLFLAAGDNGTILTSSDAVTWTSRTSGTSSKLYGVAYGAGKFVAVGTNLTIVSSLDGITWSSETPGSESSSGDFQCVAYGGSQFVVGGGDSSSTSGYIQTQVYSNNANLSGLALSSGTLSPAFASSTTSYTANVPNTVSSVKVTSTLADSNATLTVNGTAATSGNAASVPLTVGSNTITVVVTAQDGTTQKTYTVTVTRDNGGSGGSGGGGSTPPSSGGSSGGSTPPPTTQQNQPTTQTNTEVEETVNTQNQSVNVTTQDNSVVLTFPAGTFDQPVVIKVSQVTNSPSAPANNTQVAPAWSFDDGGQSLKKPVSVTFRIGHLPPGVSDQQLGIYRLVDGDWQFFNMAQSGTLSGTVTATLPHFNVWTVMAINTTFPDVPTNHWAFSNIEELVARNAVSGYPDGTFNPNGPVTRAEFVKMLAVALGLKPVTMSVQPFHDVREDAWYTGYLDAAFQAGYLEGDDQGLAHPNSLITRQEAAVILARILGASARTSGDINGFKDSNDIATWAESSIEIDVSDRLLDGYPDGTFQPLRNMQRDEAAVVVVRSTIGPSQ